MFLLRSNYENEWLSCYSLIGICFDNIVHLSTLSFQVYTTLSLLLLHHDANIMLVEVHGMILLKLQDALSRGMLIPFHF